MHTDARLVPGRVRLLSVQAPEDIEYLVKESEVLTGRSGRTFVIAGADRLVGGEGVRADRHFLPELPFRGDDTGLAVHGQDPATIFRSTVWRMPPFRQ